MRRYKVVVYANSPGYHRTLIFENKIVNDRLIDQAVAPTEPQSVQICTFLHTFGTILHTALRSDANDSDLKIKDGSR